MLILKKTKVDLERIIYSLEISDNTKYLRCDRNNSGTLHVKLSAPETITINIISRHSLIALSTNYLVFTNQNYNTYKDIIILTANTSLNGSANDYIDMYVNDVLIKTIKIKVINTTDINDYLYTKESDSYFHFSNNDQLNVLRNNLIGHIYGNGWDTTGQIPTDLPQSINSNINNTVYCNPIGLLNKSSVDRLVYQFGNGWIHYLYHIRPTISNNKAMLCFYGHSLAYEETNMQLTIKYFSDLGYHVIFSYMIQYGENITGDGILKTKGAHWEIKNLESTTPYFNPLKYFINPGIVAINYINSILPNITDIYSTGISGGGWINTITSAIDKRIKKSFSVAGSLPNWVKYPYMSTRKTDYEQGYNGPNEDYYWTTPFISDLFNNKCDYQDLYCLSSQDREHYEFYNIVDPAVFWGYYHTMYKDDIKNKINEIGVYDSFSYTYSPSNIPTHAYSQDLINQINQLIIT